MTQQAANGTALNSGVEQVNQFGARQVPMAINGSSGRKLTSTTRALITPDLAGSLALC